MAAERTVGVRELKASFSRHLRLVEEGQTVVVSTRGKAIAKLSPVEREAETVRERLLAAVRAGTIEWSGNRLEPCEPLIINTSGKMISDLLLEDRE